MADPELFQQFKGHRDAITSVHFCPHKKRVVSSSMDQTIMMWNFASDTKVMTIKWRTGDIRVSDIVNRHTATPGTLTACMTSSSLGRVT